MNLIQILTLEDNRLTCLPLSYLTTLVNRKSHGNSLFCNIFQRRLCFVSQHDGARHGCSRNSYLNGVTILTDKVCSINCSLIGEYNSLNQVHVVTLNGQHVANTTIQIALFTNIHRGENEVLTVGYRRNRNNLTTLLRYQSYLTWFALLCRNLNGNLTLCTCLDNFESSDWVSSRKIDRSQLIEISTIEV